MNTQTEEKNPIQEESKVQKDSHNEWVETQFNYAASMEQIMLIQERVQARFKDGTLVKMLEETVRASGKVSDDAVQSGIILALYMHTGFEIGKESGLHDLSELVEEVFTKKAEDKEGK